MQNVNLIYAPNIIIKGGFKCISDTRELFFLTPCLFFQFLWSKAQPKALTSQ